MQIRGRAITAYSLKEQQAKERTNKQTNINKADRINAS